MKRPNKVYISGERKRKYIKVMNPLTNVVENLFLDEDTIEQWEEIDEITVSNVSYQQSRATQEDVDNELATELGELIDKPFSRLEITDYVTFGRTERLVEHDATKEMLRKSILTPEKAEALASAIS